MKKGFASKHFICMNLSPHCESVYKQTLIPTSEPDHQTLILNYVSLDCYPGCTGCIWQVGYCCHPSLYSSWLVGVTGYHSRQTGWLGELQLEGTRITVCITVFLSILSNLCTSEQSKVGGGATFQYHNPNFLTFSTRNRDNTMWSAPTPKVIKVPV